MLVADLLQDPMQFPNEELIVSTMSGDIIVLTADTMQERWRTFLPGAAGVHSSLVVDDLNNDGKNELYVATSNGLWRFEEQ